MESNYYTPAIEDIRVGYECERFTNTWEVVTIEEWMLRTPQIGEACDSEITEFLRDLSNGKVLTPYLTKEQIEAEGWKEITDVYSMRGLLQIVKESGHTFTVHLKIRIYLSVNISHLNPEIYGVCQ